MAIGQLEYQLLGLLREYKAALQYREAYKILVLDYAKAIPQPNLQTALDAVQLLQTPKFEKAEQALLDGTPARMVLEAFLEK